MRTLAEKYAKFSDKIVIAKYDGAENDIPETVDFKLQHFPTIVLFKANGGQEGQLQGKHGRVPWWSHPRFPD